MIILSFRYRNFQFIRLDERMERKVPMNSQAAWFYIWNMIKAITLLYPRGAARSPAIRQCVRGLPVTAESAGSVSRHSRPRGLHRRVVLFTSAIVALGHLPSTAGILLTGKVIDSQGLPVSNAEVFSSTPPVYTLTNALGEFRISEQARRTEIIARPRGARLGDAPFITGSRKELLFQNRARQSLSLSLYNLQGAAVLRHQSSQPVIRLSMPRELSGLYLLDIMTQSVKHTARLQLMHGSITSIMDSRTELKAGAAMSITSSARLSAAGDTTRYIAARKGGLYSQKYLLSRDTVAQLSLVIGASTSFKTPVDYVDPFICTGGDHGQHFPGPSLPWGMVKLSPDTDPRQHSGYDYYWTQLKGFSHVRIGGEGDTGCGGSILMRPGVGDVVAQVAMNKASERAQAGYYAVAFGTPRVEAELTASERVGWHRYTFPATDSAYVLFDLSNSYAKFISSSFAINENKEIVGTVCAANNGDYGRFTVHFNAVCSKPFSFHLINQNSFALRFRTQAGEKVLFKVGLSSISQAQAGVDRERTAPGWDFDAVAAQARQRWNTVLGRVQLQGDDGYKTLFYTHLYHACLAPVDIESTSGTYMGWDTTVHASRWPGYYAGWSLWDTFRSKYPLLSITEPLALHSMCRSLMTLYTERQSFPDGWHAPYPQIRIDQSSPVLADACVKGIISAAEMQPVWNRFKNDVSGHPFEKCLDYYAIARVAGRLGMDAECESFLQQAAGYRPLWIEQFKDLLNDPQADAVGAGVYEGTKWQYRWFVPHDIQGIIDILGGRDEFRRQLEYFFDNNLYNHGNQPDIQAAYLFDFCGAPWLTQKWVHRILAEPMVQRYGTHGYLKTPYNGLIYKNTPDGYIPEMDDDVGTMSAWYVLSSLGLYAVCPGEPVYEIGTPLFREATIFPDDTGRQSKSFTISAPNVSATNIYIQSAALNGEPLDRPWLRYEEIMAGGRLELVMGAQPNTAWGSAADQAPPSMSRPSPSPFLRSLEGQHR
jgi:putative alpha-1,2-mannosidase